METRMCRLLQRTSELALDVGCTGKGSGLKGGGEYH